MSEKSKVCVVGNAGIDTNVYFYSDQISFEQEGNFTQNIDYIGQAGSYTAKGYARLGYNTSFLGFLGDDFSGDFIRKNFISHGIDVSGIGIDPTGTARSINFMFPDGRRKNFYDGKGHMTLEPDYKAAEEAFSGADIIHFHIPNWARKLLPLAKGSGATIATDLQDMTSPADPYRQDFIKDSDVIFFSAVNFKEIEPVLEALFALNDNLTIVIGMGAQGCAVARNGSLSRFPAIELPKKVIDTNGAGDGLATGFLSSYVIEKQPLEEAVLRGQICARYTCALKADSDNLISRKELNQIFQAKIKESS